MGVVAAAALLAWLWIALLRGFFWRTDQRLPAGPAPVVWPSVAIVVPARDEAAVLRQSLPSLLNQRYAGAARVILVDDNSSDGTAEVAAGLDAGGLPLTVTAPGEPPPGWTGKLWALRHGVELAGEVDLLLLTDADIEHEPGSLAALVTAAADRDLVSQMVRLRVQTPWERLIVPAFVYFFAMLYPFRWSNRNGGRTAAAAGGCTLVRRTALQGAGGIAAIRGAVIDDVALAGLIKRAGGRIWLGLADRVASIRPYPTLASLWQMVSRSAYSQLRNSVLLLIGTVLALVLIFVVPPMATVLGAVRGDVPELLAGAAAWAVMSATFIPMLRYYRQPRVAALALPVTATLYLAMTVDSARQHWLGRGAQWKGRTYETPSGGG
jgi:hopene-associated glycosyltransferase HpnB